MPETYNHEFWEFLDRLVAKSEIVIDRPKDSEHPNYDDMIYPIDYGYLAGTTSSDGSGIDVWIGASGEKVVRGIICTVDLLKCDSEIKIVLGCTREELEAISQFHNSDMTRAFVVQRQT